MTITLGAITLNSHISWRGFFNTPDVPGSEDSTLGGRTVVNRLQGNTSDIVLEAIEEDNVRKGYYLKTHLESIIAYRDAGTNVTLNYHGTVVSAVIKSDGVAVEKALWKSEFDEVEKYIGTITLKRT